jgi:hypothetical protein
MSVGTYSLCSLEDVRAFLTQSAGKSQHTGYSEADSLVEDLIDRVSTAFETYCDREFLSRERTEYYDGTGTRYLFPNYYPITSVSGIWDSTTWGWDSSNLISSDDYKIKNLNTIVLKSTVFSKDDQNIKITYTAGYGTVPNDLKQACVEEVSRAYKNRKNIDVVDRAAVDGSSTRYIKELLPTTIVVLNRYLRQGIV